MQDMHAGYVVLCRISRSNISISTDLTSSGYHMRSPGFDLTFSASLRAKASAAMHQIFLHPKLNKMGSPRYAKVKRKAV